MTESIMSNKYDKEYLEQVQKGRDEDKKGPGSKGVMDKD